MIGSLKSALRRFGRDENGSAVIPFALWTPVFVGLLIASVESGFATMRQTALDRALDETVREVKLGTGTLYTADSLKEMICDRAPILGSCVETLQLEMVGLDMRNWVAPAASPDCVDTNLTVTPMRSFVHGGQHETMLLRACFKYRPISPGGALASSMYKDDEGYTALVATSAFVHEPL
ncbi:MULTISPECIES: TadE/TadG family type IV pilus assembly protein [unclassified Salipiger]|uniref:TadE/TadG family type IV pilus assembly protein n=1 Tax=unclassified Salipiger TaxID=2640570 RepID=UPI0013B6BF9C|nr:MULTISPECIES: TadE family protein [unclassified Salipiger]NDV48301.1 pilus assembly protein [Salipiger sp. PrR003]NDW35529.1 pilus assembly protein [Salipiger sp. PrR007]